MNKNKDEIIEEIEEIFIDSNLSLHEAIGVLEIIKLSLIKTSELNEKTEVVSDRWDLE